MNAVGSSADLVFAGYRRMPVDLGEDPYRSALAAIKACEAEGRRPMRLDADDWLTLADIAARCGLSREIVRLWSIGQQGPGGFPPPLNPARDTRFYSWWETSAWIRRHTIYLPPSDGQEPALIAMNLALQLRNLMPRVSRPEAVLQCVARSERGRSWIRSTQCNEETRVRDGVNEG
jgi:hypothetical protein